ncbi:MAG: GntR family transcriptional regulator [Holdemanella sp.]|nr:GntR family transcriptional regulator [Holdemanella sp.]
MTAIYLDIQKDLLKKIESNYYRVGQIIPSEVDLAKEYHVSRPTMRQAIALLVEQGYLERRKKRGTVVTQKKIEQNFTQQIGSYDSQLHKKGFVSHTKVLTFKKEVASKEVKEILKCDTVFKLVRLRYANNKPNVFVTTYMPYSIFKDYAEYDFTSNSYYDLCMKVRHPIVTVKRQLEVTSADETLADLLEVNLHDALFYFHTIGYDPKGVPVEYSISKYRGDTNSFTFTIKR